MKVPNIAAVAASYEDRQYCTGQHIDFDKFHGGDAVVTVGYCLDAPRMMPAGSTTWLCGPRGRIQFAAETCCFRQKGVLS